MRAPFARLLLTGILAFGVGNMGCNDTINAMVNVNATVMVTSSDDVSHVTPGQSLALNVAVTGVTLVDPNTTPPANETTEAAYLEFFLDATGGTSLLTSAQSSVSVTIPSSTPPGPHKVVCQVYKHDGTPTSTTYNFDFTVVASGSVSATTATSDAGM